MLKTFYYGMKSHYLIIFICGIVLLVGLLDCFTQRKNNLYTVPEVPVENGVEHLLPDEDNPSAFEKNMTCYKGHFYNNKK